MATSQEIANAFNANFALLPGDRRARIGRLDDGEWVAFCDGQAVAFAVPEEVTSVQLVAITQRAATALWKAVEKNAQ
jgi:hypothetical protein